MEQEPCKKKLRTIDEILQDRNYFTEEQANKIEENAKEEAIKILHGGKREGAGRKAKGNSPLKFLF